MYKFNSYLLKKISIMYFSDICLWCKRLTYVIKKKGKWLQSRNSYTIHNSADGKKEIQKPKRVVKKKSQARKEGN